MRFNTGNPIGPDGSSDPRDLYDTAGIADLLVNGPLGEYLSRLGVPLKSWRGIMQQVTDYLIAQGYESTYLVYGAGLVVQRQTQLIQRNGELYRVMNAADIPLTLTGTWATDSPKLQAVGDAALRAALSLQDGGRLIGGVLPVIKSADDLEEYAGRYLGDAAYLQGFYSGSSGFGGGVVEWIAGSTDEVDRGLVFTAPGGRWKRPDTHVLTPDDFGIFHEETPSSDQTDRVQAFLSAAGGRPLTVGRPMTVGIMRGVKPASNTHMLANGFKLYALDDFVGTPLIGFMVEVIGVDDLYLNDFRVDGNQAGTAGGLSPVVGGDHPRGFGVLDNNKRVTFDKCKAANVWGNAFISFNGGEENPLSTDVRFKDCVATLCGVGFGQEVRNPDEAGGPSRVIYDNCHADLCNRGLYIAGGHAHIIGGYYHSKRQQALVTYTGDSHAPTYVTGDGSPRFRVTPEEGSNQVWLAHCIDKAESTPDYNLQEYLKVEMTGARFECDHTGASVQIETGANVTLNSPTFIGGGTQLRSSITTSTGGPYRIGVITINDPTFTGWANNAEAVLPGIPMTLNNPQFVEPGGANCGCIRLSLSGQSIIVNSPSFGSVGALQQPLNGISSAVDGTIVFCENAVNYGLSGQLYNVGSVNSEKWSIYNSTPANLLDLKKWRSGTSAPSVGTWSRGDFVWNSAPSAGGTAGFVCVSSGTPGTWKTFGPISA